MYLDLGNYIVNFYIKKNIIQNTLINLRETIIVMEKDIMLRIDFQGLLRHTPTILHLVDISIVNPKGVLEDVMVSIDSWEYPTYFIVI